MLHLPILNPDHAYHYLWEDINHPHHKVYMAGFKDGNSMAQPLKNTQKIAKKPRKKAVYVYTDARKAATIKMKEGRKAALEKQRALKQEANKKESLEESTVEQKQETSSRPSAVLKHK